MNKKRWLVQIQAAFLAICDHDTSADPNGWTPENPLWGHCAVVALVVQGIFGGDLLRASLEGTKFAEQRSHYWNRLPKEWNELEVDLTGFQFGSKYSWKIVPRAEIRERSYVLSHPETLQRYELLSLRLKGFVDEFPLAQ